MEKKEEKNVFDMTPEELRELVKGLKESNESLQVQLHAAHVVEGRLKARYETLLRAIGSEEPTLRIPKMPSIPLRRLIWVELREFAKDTSRTKHEIVAETKSKRNAIHELAEQFGFGHVMGSPVNSTVIVFKRERSGVVVPPEDPSWNEDQRLFYAVLKQFVNDEMKSTHNFPRTLSPAQRAVVHDMADRFGLDHDTFGSSSTNDKFVRVTKVQPSIRALQDRKQELLMEAVEGLRSAQASSVSLNVATEEVIPLTSVNTCSIDAGCFRIVQWNVAWMDLLLTQEDEDACRNVAKVMLDLNPACISIQEGPSSMERMQKFVDLYMPNYLVYGALEELQQQLFFLVAKDGPLKEVEVFQPALDFLSQPWQFDLEGDHSLLWYKFTRRPLVIRAKCHGKDMFFVNIHMKSKKVNKSLSELSEKGIMSAVRNRRRLIGEAYRLRECLSKCISEKFPDSPLAVMGDLNSGPGYGFFERFYLLFDAVDVLLGSPFEKTKRLYAPFLQRNDFDESARWSAVFKDFLDGRVKKVLVDHIFVNRVLSKNGGVIRTGIAHDIFQRNKKPSDHVPVYIDLKI